MEGLFKGRWYRSAVKLEGETIVPIPPFEAYDPFDFYYPAPELRQGQKSLYLEFLALGRKGPEALLKFSEKYGVLGSIENRGNLKYSRSSANPDINDLSPEDLCSPLTIEAFNGSLNAWFMNADPDAGWAESFLEQKKSFVGLVNRGIHDSLIRPQINWNIQRDAFELFWPSLTLEGYLYLMAMWDLLGPGKIISCLHCREYFLAPSNRTKFCSSTCYNKSKVQKYQKKKREELLAAKKGKKATKSTGKKK